MPQSELNPPPPHRLSKLAVTISLLTVLAAVVFGVYGPKIAARLTMLGGVPLGEMVEAAAQLRANAISRSQHEKSDSPMKADEQTANISRLLGRSCMVPNLSEAGFEVRHIFPASLPGAPYRAAEVVYTSSKAGDQQWVVLFLAADDGQYLSFDELGRPHPFAPGNLIWEDISTTNGDASVVLIWGDGPVLYLLCVEDDDQAEKLSRHIAEP